MLVSLPPPNATHTSSSSSFTHVRSLPFCELADGDVMRARAQLFFFFVSFLYISPPYLPPLYITKLPDAESNERWKSQYTRTARGETSEYIRGPTHTDKKIPLIMYGNWKARALVCCCWLSLSLSLQLHLISRLKCANMSCQRRNKVFSLSCKVWISWEEWRGGRS